MLLKADVTDEIAVNARFKEFVSTTGALHGLVNNAGVATLGLLALSRDSAPLRAMIETNLLGTILCSRAALTIMYRQRHGAIVNMGSVAGIRPSTGQAVYAATKGGVLAFSNALAVECGQAGIRVNCLSPGGVRTDMLAAAVGTDIEKLVRRSPLGSLASIEDIAASVAFLLSSEAASITGAHLTVDAGYSTGFLSENS
jgi:3-oxoacyl-[acyl-carrier protein] reductase